MTMPKQLTIFDFIPNPYESLEIEKPHKLEPIKNLNSGIPYKGSKKKISHLILQEIRKHAPKAKYFYDVFGGGGAMALNAHYNGYKTHYNELDIDVYLYMKFLISQLQNKKGKYGILPDEWYRFITKAEFDRIKADKTPSAYRSFVLLNYSFGNDWHSYFCTASKELFKLKGHYLIIDNDKDCAEWWDNHFKQNDSVVGVYNHLHSEIYPSLNWRERRTYFVNLTFKIEAIRVAGIAHLFQKKSNADTYNAVKDITQKDLCRLIDKHNPDLPKKNYKKATRRKGLVELRQLGQIGQIGQLERLERLERLEGLQQLEGLDGLQQLQRLERLQQLERLERLERLEKLQRLQRLERLEGLQQLQRLEQIGQLDGLELITHTNLDYAEVKISTPPQDTIIYADPPYANTSEYKLSRNSFDYERFYQWCIDKAKQGYYVFISEYNMPQDRFREIWSKETYASFSVLKSECGAKNRPLRTERLFTLKV